MTALIDRYLAAALRGIPEKQRPDVEAELRSSVADEVEDRVAAGEDRTVAERTVLNGLGEPTRLAAGLAGQPLHLIGPDLFLVYRHVLTMLAVVAVPIVGAVAGIAAFASDANAGAALIAGAGAAWNVGVHLAFWVTIVFVLIERVDEARDTRDEIKAATGKWNVDMLPALPPGRVSAGDTVGEVLGSVVGIGGLVFLSSSSWLKDGAGNVIPLFTASFASFWLPVLIAILAGMAAVHLLVFLAGRWTIQLAAVYALVQLAFSVPMIWLVLTGSLINPAFADALGWPPLADSNGWAIRLFAALVAVVTAWEIFSAFRKARSASMRTVPA